MITAYGGILLHNVAILASSVVTRCCFQQAGETFVTISLHHTKLGNKHDAATNYVDAANCFKKSDPKGLSGFSSWNP